MTYNKITLEELEQILKHLDDEYTWEELTKDWGIENLEIKCIEVNIEGEDSKGKMIYGNNLKEISQITHLNDFNIYTETTIFVGYPNKHGNGFDIIWAKRNPDNPYWDWGKEKKE